jgi:hypothetical protein
MLNWLSGSRRVVSGNCSKFLKNCVFTQYEYWIQLSAASRYAAFSIGLIAITGQKGIDPLVVPVTTAIRLIVVQGFLDMSKRSLRVKSACGSMSALSLLLYPRIQTHRRANSSSQKCLKQKARLPELLRRPR